MQRKLERPAYGDVRTGALIREVRRLRRVSQLELAREAGCSEQLIGHIERGFRAVTPAVREAVAGRLGLQLPDTTDGLAEAIQRLTEAYASAESAA